MSLDQELIRLIDARIAAARQTTTAFGTVRSRDPGFGDGGVGWPEQYTAMINFDGDTISVPVLCPANVRARPGDRVVLHKVAGQWTIGGSFGSPGAGSFNNFPTWGWKTQQHSGTDSTTSSSYLTMGTLSVYFAKETDWAWIDVDFRASFFYTGTFAGLEEVRFGVRFTNRDTAAVTDWDLVDFAHGSLSGIGDRKMVTARNNRIFVDPGEYDVTVIWKRTAGTAVPTANADDSTCLLLSEHVVAYYERLV